MSEEHAMVLLIANVMPSENAWCGGADVIHNQLLDLAVRKRIQKTCRCMLLWKPGITIFKGLDRAQSYAQSLYRA